MNRNHVWAVEWEGPRGWERMSGKWYSRKEDAMNGDTYLERPYSPGEKYRVAKYVRVEQKGGAR